MATVAVPTYGSSVAGGGIAVFNPNTGKPLAGAGAYNPNTGTAINTNSTAQPVNANNIGTTTAPVLPNPPAVNPAYSNALASAGIPTAPTTTTTSTTAPTTAAPTSSMADYFKEYLGLVKPPANTADIYAQASNEAGVEQKRQRVQSLTGQLNGIVANSQAAQLSTTGQGRGIPEAIIGGQQAQIAKEAAIQALPIQAQLAAAQGDLQMAQEHLDTLFKLRSQDAQAQVDYNNKVVDAVYNFATKAEQQKLDEAKTKRETNLAQANNEGDYAKKLAFEATSNGQGILGAKIAALTPPDPSSATFSQDMAKYKGDIAKLTGQVIQDPLKTAQLAKLNAEITPSGAVITSDPKRAQAISTILGSGKFTKEQANTIKNAINNGEDPFTVIKNQAKALMTGANQTKIESYETAQSALDSLEKNLSDFYKLGGKTNIFAGNYEKAINKVGEVSDPKLVQLATQIQQNLQIYRNAVSGTAYSVQEGADIASIFPGITKSEGLNNAIIKGRKQAFNDGIDGAYKGVLGSTYQQFKDSENSTNSSQATGTPKGKQSDSQYVESTLSSQGIKYADITSKTPAGQKAVIDNKTGQIGYIPANEYNASIYTQI